MVIWAKADGDLSGELGSPLARRFWRYSWSPFANTIIATITRLNVQSQMNTGVDGFSLPTTIKLCGGLLLVRPGLDPQTANLLFL